MISLQWLLIIQDNRFGMQLSQKGHNNAKPTRVKIATQLLNIKVLFPTSGRGGWAQKVLESKTERLQLHIAVLLMAVLLIYLHFED